MSKRLTAVSLGSLVFLAVAHAQYAKPPEVYSATEVNAIFGPSVTMKVDRDGWRALVESTTPGSPGTHTKAYYDLQTHKNYSWDANYPTPKCSGGTFSGDWGDPFETTAGLMKELAPQNPQPAGSETVNGFTTKVFEAGAGAEKVKLWRDTKYGLAVKVQLGEKTIIEVKTLSLVRPPASLFTLPAACATVPPTDPERVAAETSGKVGDFTNAIMAPSPRSASSCSVLLRVLRAGTMEPIISGFQVAIDPAVNPDHMPSYTVGAGADGHATFSGGGLHEMTAQLRNGVLRIDNAPPQFYLDTYFGKAGDASALIYRNCISLQTVLLLVVKNPAKLGEGADWLWAKSGKFAAGN